MATEVANIFNKEILDDNSQIKTGRSAKIDDIKQDIVVAGEQLMAEDKEFFTDKHIEIMRAIGVLDIDELLCLDAGSEDAAGEDVGETENDSEESEAVESNNGPEQNDDDMEPKPKPEPEPKKKPKKGKKAVTKSTAKKKDSDKEKAEKKEEKPKKKAAVKKDNRAEKKKKPSARQQIAEIVIEGKTTRGKLFEKLDGKVEDKYIKMYLRAWTKGDRCPEGSIMKERKNGNLYFE